MKHTKKALLSSALSMLLCVSMLIGSTFAWFTDSVTSGRNQITAGNLDIELEYRPQTVSPETGAVTYGEFTPVTSTTSLFDEDVLWEPGYTQVVYLKVKNVGSLALKYQLAMSILGEERGINVYDERFALSDYLMYGVVFDVTEPFADRASALAALDESMHLADYSVEEALAPAVEGAESSDTLALIVYMPEAVGNDANYRGDAVPHIDLGITLVAKQDTVEEDSFNDQYDADAEYPYVVNGKIVYIEFDSESGLYVNKLDKEDKNLYVADIGSFLAWEKNVLNDKYLTDNIVLLKSLDLTGQTWSNAGNFQGTFNGLGNTLSHLGKRLFSYVRGAEFRNVTLQFDNADGGLTYGTSYGNQDDPVIVSNVTIEGTITNGAAFFPYIQSETSVEAGTMKGEEFIIENCTNNANVTGTYNRACAFVGTSYGSTFTIRDCVNNGDLTMTTSRESHGAAFAGYVMRDTSGKTTGDYTCTIERCINNGDIYTIGTGDSRNNVGGMISTAHEGYFVVTDCVNNGNITGYNKNNGTPNIGGLIGRINSNNVTVTGCTNTGTITARTTGASANAKNLFGLNNPKVSENNTENGKTVVETNYVES